MDRRRSDGVRPSYVRLSSLTFAARQIVRLGILTQAPAGIDSLEVRVKAFYRAREGKQGNIYLGLPHRLDRPVSGAIVFARHVRAAQRLATQFENRTVTKVYWAVVEGDVQPDEGTWTDHLHKRHGMPQSIIVPPDDPRGKLAVMHYRVLARLPLRGRDSFA